MSRLSNLLAGLRPKPIHDLDDKDGIASLLLDDADQGDTHVPSGHASDETFEAYIEPLIAEAEAAEPAGETSAPEPVAAAPAAVVEPIPAPTRRPDTFRPAARQAPQLAAQPGDLVFVFGLREDAMIAAQALATARTGIDVAVAGSVARPGFRHVGDRREATQARADGVSRNRSTIVAIGVGQAPGDAEQYTDAIRAVVPDQVWIAVDVTRKPEDTRAWAQAVARATTGIDAIAALGVAYTTTPDSTDFLGVPVGWSDTPA